MAYLGRGIENLSDRVVLDSLTASATASYTLQLNSVNFVPSSASSLTVSLNGVIQKPDSSYTVSGSTLTFSSALTSSDSIDFIIAERGITLQTPSAGSVNTDQLAASAVTNAKIASNAAIATTKLGSGALLGHKRHAYTTTTTFSDGNGTNTTITDSEFSYTPKASNSTILLFSGTQINLQPTSVLDARMNLTLQYEVDDGGSYSNAGTSGQMHVSNGTGGDNCRVNAVVSGEIVNHGASTKLDFRMTGNNGGGGGNRINHNGTSYITILEIAG